MNKFKRWYYELSEKQIIRISTIMAIIGILFGVINFFITYSLGRLPKGDDFFLYTISLFALPLLLAFLVYEILWFLPSKQTYMWKKNYDEIILRVRELFGLGPEFKEVLYSPKETGYNFLNYPNLLDKLDVKYFAKEMDGVILVSIRDKDGEELVLQEISNYYFFDSNFNPK